MSKNKKYLIGPNLYSSYYAALKLALSLGLSITSVFLALQLTRKGTANPLDSVVGFISSLIGVGAQIAFYVTAVFAAAEYAMRNNPDQLKQFAKDINVDDEKKTKISKHIPRSDTIIDLVGSVFLLCSPLLLMTVWTLEQQALFAPQYATAIYISLVVIGAIGIGEALLKLASGIWSAKVLAVAIFSGTLTIAALLFVLLTPNIINPEFVDVIRSKTDENVTEIIRWSVAVSAVTLICINLYDMFTAIRSYARLGKE